jgi:hypothetical protein
VARSVSDANVYVRGNYSYIGFGTQSGQAQHTVAWYPPMYGTFSYSGYEYVVGTRSRVMIDPNIRVRGNATYAGFEDVDGPIAVGEAVEVYEPESGITGQGCVTEIDAARELVYLSVDWSSLTAEEQQGSPAPQGAVLYISPGMPETEDYWMNLLVRPSLAYIGFSNATLWVTAPARGWSANAMLAGLSSPYLEIPSQMEIWQPFAELSTDQVVAM